MDNQMRYVMNDSINMIRMGVTLYEERDLRIVIGQILRELGFFEGSDNSLIITVDDILNYRGYDSKTGEWNDDNDKGDITYQVLLDIKDSK